MSMYDDLRDYQRETIAKLRQSLASGKRKPVVQAPTGAGKTIMAAAIVRMAREKGKRVIFCVPAISLIDQTVDKFARNGITEVGVIQAAHPMTDHTQPVQVCSVQTLSRRKIPETDLVIVDECHVRFKLYDEWFDSPAWKKIPFVGLTATPWSKGMGKLWDDLVVCTTTAELIERGHLSDFKTYAPAHPDLSKVKTVAGDYELKGLGEAMNKKGLVADIVSTWLERGEGRPTLCFCVDRLHAKHVQEQFKAAGVSTDYIDAFTDLEDRKEIERRFIAGFTKIVCNVGVLTTGIDWDVRCIILARPTKSEILFTQIIGRGLRTAVGKDYCLILDHSDTTLRLGFVTDIHHPQLDLGANSRPLLKDKEILPKECPKCAFLKPPKARECPSCGFVAEPKTDLHNAEGELHELTRGKKLKPSDWPLEFKQKFYSELILYSQQKGYKKGWAYWKYKTKFGVAPSHLLRPVAATSISPDTQSWIKHVNIAQAKAKAKASGSSSDYRRPAN